jgi:Co/Zn/Cd efflux system component
MMQHDKHPLWQHGHGFGQDQKRPGEVRTIIVIAITGIMMVVEIATGVLFGSMALLADGLHMASHASALSINAVIITVVTSDPKPAEYYKQLIPSDLNLVHVNVEVQQY